MRIAINTRFLLKGKLEGIGWFTYEIIRRIVLNHPEHEFIFLFDRPYDAHFVFAENVTPIVISPPARHPILWYVWFEISVKRALKKYNIDLFISTDGFLSLSTEVPTLLVLHDLAFEKFPKHIPFKFRYFLQKFTPKYAFKAKQIVTVSEFSKSEIINLYGIDAEKISVVHNGANKMYAPLLWHEKETVKEKYALGCEYFVFAGALHPRKNVVALLQAFALFKKRQKSNMKLLIIGRFAWNSNEIEKTLKEHPFKNDVIRYNYMQVEELCKVIGGAYGLTFVSLYEGFGIPVLEAIQCNVPGIVANVSSLPEVAGETALYVNPNDVDDIANQMCIFYKNEHLRETLAKNCATQSRKFNWDESARKFYDVMMKVAQ
jgi:glycosyltransferase involved in cell wall biosynthesis